jgi:hypothetical protein
VSIVQSEGEDGVSQNDTSTNGYKPPRGSLEDAVGELREASKELAGAIRSLWGCWQCGAWNREYPCPRCGAEEDFEKWRDRRRDERANR